MKLRGSISDNRLVVGAVLLALAAIFRFARLGLEGLWCDEAYTAWLIRMPLGEMITTLIQTDDAPPIFYICQKFITTFVGQSEFGLRFISASCGCLVVLYLALRSIRERDNASMWSAIFFGVTSFSIFYARQARSYGLILLLIFIFILAARDLLRGSSRWAGPLLALSGSLLALSHNIGGVIVFSSLPLWLVYRGVKIDRIKLRSWLLWHLLPVAICLLWLGLSRSQLTIHATLNQWMAGFWETHNLFAAPWLSCRAWVPGLYDTGLGSIALPTMTSGKAIWFALSLAALIVTFFYIVRGYFDLGRRREILLYLGYLVLPLGGLLAVSLLWAPVYVVGRSDLIVFPALVLLIGIGLSRMPRWGAALILSLWALISLISLQSTYGLGQINKMKGTDRSIAAFMADGQLAPGDWMIHSNLTQPTFAYYLGRSDINYQTAWFPKESGINPSAVVQVEYEQLDRYLAEAIDLRSQIEQDLPETGKVWLVATVDNRHAGDPSLWRAPGAMMTANQITFPTSLMLYSLVGVKPMMVARLYRQDWIAGDRVLIPIPKAEWLPVENLPPIQTEGDDGR